jgi:hypothetical protein
MTPQKADPTKYDTDFCKVTINKDTVKVVAVGAPALDGVVNAVRAHAYINWASQALYYTFVDKSAYVVFGINLKDNTKLSLPVSPNTFLLVPSFNGQYKSSCAATSQTCSVGMTKPFEKPPAPIDWKPAGTGTPGTPSAPNSPSGNSPGAPNSPNGLLKGLGETAKGLGLPIIIAIVAGGVLILIAIIVIIYCACCRKKQSDYSPMRV